MYNRLTIGFGALALAVGLAGQATAGGKPVKEDLGPLIAALAGTETEAAVAAIAKLGASTQQGAHDAILDALAFGPHPSVVLAALPALAAHPAPADAVVIARYASYRAVAVRSAALTALASYPDPKSKKTLVRGLSDLNAKVRAAAADAIAKAKLREGVDGLMVLLGKGEQAAANALAALADPELARVISETIGQTPDDILASCLGAIIKRADFGPDSARSQVVAAIGKIPSNDAITVLTDYVDTAPKNPPRLSVKEAEKLINDRMGGGDK